MSFGNRKILGVIPARGGSKGILGKNLIEVGGKPLIAWTIEAALRSGALDRLMVSTDDEEIADVARKCGAEVPWYRPDELARDDSAIIDGLIYEVKRLENDLNYIADLVMLLQPTSPLRTSENIIEAVELHKEKKASSVVSVCEALNHPYLIKKVDDQGRLSNFLDLPIPETSMNRQNLPPAYMLNGAIYLFERKVLLAKKSLYGNPTFAYVMPQYKSHDIDDHFDLAFINLLIGRDPMSH
jgi:N-acylneuraminate cytidylyltransferase/CMP-N,N'-diacetyllegionaminic acid synthase